MPRISNAEAELIVSKALRGLADLEDLFDAEGLSPADRLFVSKMLEKHTEQAAEEAGIDMAEVDAEVARLWPMILAMLEADNGQGTS